jgi:hypothetical protein
VVARYQEDRDAAHDALALFAGADAYYRYMSQKSAVAMITETKPMLKTGDRAFVQMPTSVRDKLMSDAEADGRRGRVDRQQPACS